MDNREAVYLETYVAAHNERLRRHPQYRTDMKFHLGSARGALVQQTGERLLNDGDALVFDEIRRDVSFTHRLILA